MVQRPRNFGNARKKPRHLQRDQRRYVRRGKNLEARKGSDFGPRSDCFRRCCGYRRSVSLTEIEKAVKELSREELAKLAAFIARQDKLVWDEELEQDFSPGGKHAAALEKIAQAEAQALAEVRREAVDVATAATTRLIAKVLDDSKASALIDQSIAEVNRRLH